MGENAEPFGYSYHIIIMLHKALELLLGSSIRSLSGDRFAELGPGELSPLVALSAQRELKARLRNNGYKQLRPFVAIPSRQSVRWLIPVDNTSVISAASQIYEPHKLLPRLLKTVLFQMPKAGFDGTRHAGVLVASRELLPVEKLVYDLTGEAQPIFAFSFGRQEAVRKLTVQVMRPTGEILGYIKLPLTDAATVRVQNEAKALQSLWAFPPLRPHVPRLLHAGSWFGSYMLFQSPLLGTRGPTVISRSHHEFFEALWGAHRVRKGGLTLVDEVARRWKNNVSVLDSSWTTLGHEALSRAARQLGNGIVDCGIGHGDFAPWNTRTSNGRLLVFDWESAGWEIPALWDVIHFGLQTEASSLQRRSDPENASNTGAVYILYLLNSVIQFCQEENPIAIQHRKRVLMQELQRSVSLSGENRPSTDEVVGSRSAVIGIISSRPRPVRPIVTTSWDDGDPRDTRLGELLESRGLKGTFYIPLLGYLRRPTLAPPQIRELAAAGFEIGAHSVSHKSLTRFKRVEEVEKEVRVCKDELEQIIGEEVPMFCYPNGRYNAEIIRAVKRAGYKGARTTQMLSVTTKFDHFEMPTTVQAYPHRSSNYIKDLGRARNLSGLWRFTTQLSGFEDWRDMGRRLFNQVMERGGIWHLYGHSWELDEFNLWSELDRVLDFVSNREGVLYLTNSQVLSVVTQ